MATIIMLCSPTQCSADNGEGGNVPATILHLIQQPSCATIAISKGSRYIPLNLLKGGYQCEKVTKLIALSYGLGGVPNFTAAIPG